MSREYKQTLISYRLERARESLDAGQLLLNNGMLTSSMKMQSCLSIILKVTFGNQEL
jgi:hypothetical protein